MLNEIPSWLRSFRITIKSLSDTTLFDSWHNDIQELKFDDTLGGQKGTDIVLSQKSYKIEGIQLYTDMTTDFADQQKNNFLFQITIIVNNKD